MNIMANFNLNWTYSGVNHNLTGNGGPVCWNYLSLNRRAVETFAFCALSLAYMIYGLRHLHVPKLLKKNLEQKDRFGKRILLVVMCLTFGCEVGFKLSTKTVIYLLNPCHVITATQIYLLASPPRPHTTIIFRCQFHCLNGALLALLFPVLNTRMLPFEKEVYYIEHIMILVIPFYLLRVGGVYTLERLNDFSWMLFVLGTNLLYHFIILQSLGLITQVNLNNMLCPAVSDPFRGGNYRIWAVIHQSILIAILGKVYTLMACFLLVLIGHQGVIHHPEEYEKKVSDGKSCSCGESSSFWSKFSRLVNCSHFLNHCNNISNGHVD